MKKEFPPEKDIEDDLYEAEHNNTPKAKIKLEKSAANATKTSKPKTTTKDSSNSILHSLKKNNAILTPEFAHAQILQAQAQLLHKTQFQHCSNVGDVPQILPKLGIPQELTAKLTPAQMQLLMMQLRSGTISTQNLINQSMY